MLTATLTIPALGIRARGAFLAGLEVEPFLSVAQPGDGSAVFTLADTTPEAAETLRKKLSAFGAVRLDLAEVAPVEESAVEPDVAAVAEVEVTAEATPETFDVVVEVATAVEVEVVTEVNAPVAEVPAVAEPVTEPTVVHLSGLPARELVEQGQALVRALQAGTYTFAKPSTGWKGSTWCVRFAEVERDALSAAMAGLACAATVSEDAPAVNDIPVEITVEVTAEIAAAAEPKRTRRARS